MRYFLFIFLITTVGVANATDSVTGPTKIHNDMYIVTMSLTASGGTFSSLAINNDNANAMTLLTGYWLSHVKVIPGATGPTDDSDLTLTFNGVDILGGNGANIVDNATNGYCVPFGSNTDAQYPMSGSDDVLTVNITNNLVATASVTVILVFER
jgi:hypothetical protein